MVKLGAVADATAASSKEPVGKVTTVDVNSSQPELCHARYSTIVSQSRSVLGPNERCPQQVNRAKGFDRHRF